jgi:hypothetical protein
MAGLEALGNGGARDEYRGGLAAVRREALARMRTEAAGPGANAKEEMPDEHTHGPVAPDAGRAAIVRRPQPRTTTGRARAHVSAGSLS